MDTAWADRLGGGMRARIGCADDGTDLHLDIQELIDAGNSPHGALVGATGCGKTLLVNTVVRSFHDGDHEARLSTLLVDLKGGGGYRGLVGLPGFTLLETSKDFNEQAIAELFGEMASVELQSRLLQAKNSTSGKSIRSSS